MCKDIGTKEILDICELMIKNNIATIELDKKVNIKAITDGEKILFERYLQQNNITICIPDIMYTISQIEIWRENGIKIYRS